jgi:hypothetical protein
MVTACSIEYWSVPAFAKVKRYRLFIFKSVNSGAATLPSYTEI